MAQKMWFQTLSSFWHCSRSFFELLWADLDKSNVCLKNIRQCERKIHSLRQTLSKLLDNYLSVSFEKHDNWI